MADVLDIDNAEEFEVDEEGDRKYPSCESGNCGINGRLECVCTRRELLPQYLLRTHISFTCNSNIPQKYH